MPGRWSVVVSTATVAERLASCGCPLAAGLPRCHQAVIARVINVSTPFALTVAKRVSTHRSRTDRPRGNLEQGLSTDSVDVLVDDKGRSSQRCRVAADHLCLQWVHETVSSLALSGPDTLSRNMHL